MLFKKPSSKNKLILLETPETISAVQETVSITHKHTLIDTKDSICRSEIKLQCLSPSNGKHTNGFRIYKETVNMIHKEIVDMNIVWKIQTKLTCHSKAKHGNLVHALGV